MTEDYQSLITTFQENKEKVGRLNSETTNEIGAKLMAKRQQQFKLPPKRIAGRKMKIVAGVALSLTLSMIPDHLSIKAYRAMREKTVMAWERSLIPFFQVIDDRGYLIHDHRRNIAIEATFTDPEQRHEFESLVNPFKLTKDWMPITERHFLSNLALPYHCEPVFRNYSRQTTKKWNNPLI